MYYYVVDPPKPNIPGKVAQKLQDIIAPYGVSGEIAIASPARSAEELTYMGLDKGYTTIVAVGGDNLVNTIATIIVNEAKEATALGIIPIGADSFLTSLTGVPNNNLRPAVEVLKQRHLYSVDLVHIAPKRYMLTDALIFAPKPVKFTLDIDQVYRAEVDATFAKITNELVMTIGTTPKSSGFMKLFKSAPTVQPVSQFHGRQIRCVTNEPLAVNVGGEVVAKTPTTFSKVPYGLKVVIARSKVLNIGDKDGIIQTKQTDISHKELA